MKFSACHCLGSAFKTFCAARKASPILPRSASALARDKESTARGCGFFVVRRGLGEDRLAAMRRCYVASAAFSNEPLRNAHQNPGVARCPMTAMAASESPCSAANLRK